MERLRLNLKTSEQLSEGMLEMKETLEKLYGELALSKRDTQSLREEINRLATKLCLDPIQIEQT